MNAIQHLPQKYNEIIRILFNKEMRIYLPIEELNLLLEPIPRMDEGEEDESNDDNISTARSEQENESDITSSMSSDDSLIDVKEDSVDSSHSSLENFEIFN